MSKVLKPEILTPSQCRAARALLGWSQSDLENRAGVARKTLADFEGGKRPKIYERTLRDIRQTLEEGGVRFVDANGDGPGVRLRQLIWKLAPIDPDDFNWAASTYRDEVIIRAADERRARQIAAGAFLCMVERKSPGQPTALNPWGALTGTSTCERLTDSEFPEDEPEAVLSPAEYDSEWRP